MNISFNDELPGLSVNFKNKTLTLHKGYDIYRLTVKGIKAADWEVKIWAAIFSCLFWIMARSKG